MRKIPPWAWALIAVGAGTAFYLYKKHKEAQEIKASESTSSSTEQSTAVASEEGFPYGAGEYPGGGYGGGGGGIAGPIAGANESQQEFHELFGQQQTFEKEFLTSQQTEQQSIAEQIRNSEESISKILGESIKGVQTPPTSGSGTISSGSSGGAPSSPGPGGTTTAPPPPTQPSCPSAFPNHNAAKGAVGPGSCWRWSRDKTGGGCACHGYQSGALECEQGKAPHCHW